MANTYNDTHLINTLPPQKVSNKKKKTQAWQESSVNAVVSFGNARNQYGRTSAQEKQIKYDLVNSIVNNDDLKYVLDPYGMGDKQQGQPARLRDINQVFNKISLLKGEEINRPFNIRAIAVNGEAIIEKEDKKRDMQLQLTQKMLMEELGYNDAEPITDPRTGEEVEPTFEGVEHYANYSMQDIRESWANDAMKYIRHEQKLDLKFNEGWEHGLISAEEIYYVGISNNKPTIRVCNPINCEFDRNPDNPRIEDGDWFREDRWMTKNQILDEYSEYLTDKEVDRLDSGELRSNLQNQMFPGYGYEQETMRQYEQGSFRASDRSNGTHLLVTHVVWRSMEKVGFLTIPAILSGEDEVIQVDDSFKLDKEMLAAGYTLEWKWRSDLWHGTKLGDDFIIQVERVPNQIRSMEDPFNVPLPYVGRIYNSTNTKQTSLVDLIKPHQYLLNITWYRLETELAKASGKKFIFDIAQLPKSQGWDFDKWMYMFDTAGVAVINSMEEGKGHQQGKMPNFNGMTSVDMTLSQSIGQYIMIISKIESTIDKIVGITPQREGNIHQSETVGGIEQARSASSHITEPWFYIHNEVKKAVVSQLIEAAKLAWVDNKQIDMILDDVQRIHTKINMDMFADSDYGIFMSDSSKEHQTFQKLEMLAQQALSSGAATYSDIIKMFSANSIAELSSLIEESEAKKIQQEQQAQQAQQELQQQMLDAQSQEKMADRAFEAEQAQLDRDARLQEAAIKVTGFDTDTADNNRLDALDEADRMIKDREISNKTEAERGKQNLERDKLRSQERENEKDRTLKRQEMKSKERIEKTKLKNPVPGEVKKK